MSPSVLHLGIPPSIPDSRGFTSEEDGSTDNSEASPRQPNRDKGHRHWDERGARQEMELSEQEPTRPPRTALKDSRVNFRLGLQAKVANTAPKIPPPAPAATPSSPRPSLNVPCWGMRRQEPNTYNS